MSINPEAKRQDGSHFDESAPKKPEAGSAPETRVGEPAGAYDVAYVPLGAAAFGGAERSLLELAQRMHRRGLRVVVIADAVLRGTQFETEAVRAGLDLEWAPWSADHGLLRNAREAWRVFRRLKARIVHFNVAWRAGFWIVPLVARSANRALLMGTMRVMPDPHYLIPKQRYFGCVPGLRLWHWRDVFRGWVWARTLSQVVAINKTDFPPRLVADYGFSPRKMSVIHNGIRAREREPDAAERAAARARLGLPADRVLVTFAGRLEAVKGAHVLIRAAAALPDEALVVIAGEGRQRPALERMVEDLGLADRVHFAGYVPEPGTLMAASDIVAVPSLWWEAFGRVVIEAMNQGVPVVASRIGGMGELFEHGQEGLYVAPDDSEGLAEALRQLIADPRMRRSMGEAGARLVRSAYSIDRVEQEYRALYERIGVGR